MTTTDSPAADSGAPTIPTTVLDDDNIARDLEVNPTPKAADTPPEKKDEPKTEAPKDADQLVLELSARTREATKSKQSFEAKTKELDGHIARHKEFDSVLALAESDPMQFVLRLAEAAKLDVNTIVEAYTAHKSGSTRELTEAERIARLEAEKKTSDAKAEADRIAREKTEGETAIAAHVNAIKSLATAGKDNFPLANANIEAASNAAFDLMVLAHEAKLEVPSYAAALQQIENTLRADAEKSAALLGYTKASPAPTTPTAPQVQPRPNGSAAPIVATSQIKSDEEIADDWIHMRSAR